jgi:DNA-binding NarL/FixJ family response regulator
MEDLNQNSSEVQLQESPKPGRRGAPHKLGSVQAEVCELYAAGASSKIIAAKYGVSVTCVISTLRRCGVAVRSKGRQRPHSI